MSVQTMFQYVEGGHDTAFIPDPQLFISHSINTTGCLVRMGSGVSQTHHLLAVKRMLLVLVDDEFSLQNPLSLKSDLSWASWYISEYQ